MVAGYAQEHPKPTDQAKKATTAPTQPAPPPPIELSEKEWERYANANNAKVEADNRFQQLIIAALATPLGDSTRVQAVLADMQAGNKDVIIAQKNFDIERLRIWSARGCIDASGLPTCAFDNQNRTLVRIPPQPTPPTSPGK
jgi:hypothetical protein